MTKWSAKVTKEPIKRLNAYSSYYDRKINILPFLGLVVGLTVGIVVNLRIFRFLNTNTSQKALFLPPFSEANVLNYPKYGSAFGSLIAYAIFFALLGVTVGKGLEVLIRKLVKKS